MSFRLVCIYFIFVVSLWSVEEGWSVPESKVGEIVVYTLSHPELDPSRIESPNMGIYPESSDLPVFEILSVQTQNGKLEIRARFLESGEHSLPVTWKTVDGKEEVSQAKILIKSNLTGSEFDLDDITEPMEFSGPYLLKLLGWLLLVCSIFGLVAYFLLKYKKKQPEVRDASFQNLPPVVYPTKSKNKLEAMLDKEEINHKEFVFALSETVKERFGKRVHSDLQSFTNKDLLFLIQKKTEISDLERMRLENYLDIVKYMPNEETITKEFAKKVYDNWMEIIER
jgi:hypothetical protein